VGPLVMYQSLKFQPFKNRAPLMIEKTTVSKMIGIYLQKYLYYLVQLVNNILYNINMLV